MIVKSFVAGIYVDYKSETITLESLVITENRLIANLYRIWNNLDFDAMIKGVNNCSLLRKLQQIYYDQYSMSNDICKKLDDRFVSIPMNNDIRCRMIETVNSLIPTISCVKDSPVSKQHHFLYKCRNSQDGVIYYPSSNVFTANVEAFCLALYGSRTVITKYIKKQQKTKTRTILKIKF